MEQLTELINGGMADALRMLLLIWLSAINLAAFLFYGEDKRRAVRDLWRIPEANLLGLAALGGSIGALAAMLVFRHKIRKPRFFLGVPALLGLQVILGIMVWRLVR